MHSLVYSRRRHLSFFGVVVFDYLKLTRIPLQQANLSLYSAASNRLFLSWAPNNKQQTSLRSPANQNNGQAIAKDNPTKHSPEALATLERRLDRLEFELRKAFHQQQMMAMLLARSNGQIAAGGLSGAESALSGSDRNKVDGFEQADLLASNGNGRQQIAAQIAADNNNKWTSLPERLELMEKFITVTTRKVSLLVWVLLLFLLGEDLFTNWRARKQSAPRKLLKSLLHLSSTLSPRIAQAD